MRIKRLWVSKSIIVVALLFWTGIPFLFLKKVFLPSQVIIPVSFCMFLSFLLLWRELVDFKKDVKIWVLVIPIVAAAFCRKWLLPPPTFRIYDLFFIFIALSLLYQPSQIKELLTFSSLLIAPISLAQIYGYMPTVYQKIFLILSGYICALLLPWLFKKISKKELKRLDTILCMAGIIFFAAFSFLMMSFSVGQLKNGQVLFDIGHGTSQSPLLDYTRNVATGAVYGHARLTELLSSFGFHRDNIETISHDSLAGASVLTLIMPSIPYTREEINAIKEFVASGGGLLAIGDHTNINNCLSSLNPVIGEFGIHLRFDTLWLMTNERSDVEYRHHPTIFDLERVNFSVGASLELTSPARAVIQSGYATYSDRGDPNNEARGYLGNSLPDPEERIHDLCLAAQSHYGKGRVFVLADSAYFQNTCLYQNMNFAYRLFDWLNHYESKRGIKQISLLILLVGFILLFLFIIIYRKVFPSVCLPVLLFSLFFALWLSGFYNCKRLPIPPKPKNTIFIDMAHQNEYTLYWINRAKQENGLDGLVDQITRNGLYPVIATRDGAPFTGMNDHKAVFIICSNTPFSAKEIEAIAQFVEDGGGLLLVDGPRKWASCDTLWERFGLFKDRYPLSVDIPILSPLGLPMQLPYGNFQAQFIPHIITQWVFRITMVNPCKVYGGQPIAFVNGTPVINIKDFGKGRIVAIGDDRFFANYLTEFDGRIIDPDKIRIIWNIISYLVKE